MPQNQTAKTFVRTVIALGTIFVMHAVVSWAGDPFAVAGFILLATLASTLKAPLPGIPGAFSANCLVTALAIALLNTSELVIVSIACALVQSSWRASAPPVQLAFNAGVFAISGALSGWTYAAGVRFLPPLASLFIASCLFFIINTGAVSLVMALNDGGSALRIWRLWHVWSLPYYLVNVGLAMLLLRLVPSSTLQAALLIIPSMLVLFAVYRWWMRRAAPVVAQVA